MTAQLGYWIDFNCRTIKPREFSLKKDCSVWVILYYTYLRIRVEPSGVWYGTWNVYVVYFGHHFSTITHGDEIDYCKILVSMQSKHYDADLTPVQCKYNGRMSLQTASQELPKKKMFNVIALAANHHSI